MTHPTQLFQLTLSKNLSFVVGPSVGCVNECNAQIPSVADYLIIWGGLWA